MKNKNLLKKAISGLILSTMAFTTMCPVISWAEKLSIQQTQKIKNEINQRDKDKTEAEEEKEENIESTEAENKEDKEESRKSTENKKDKEESIESTETENKEGKEEKEIKPREFTVANEKFKCYEVEFIYYCINQTGYHDTTPKKAIEQIKKFEPKELIDKLNFESSVVDEIVKQIKGTLKKDITISEVSPHVFLRATDEDTTWKDIKINFSEIFNPSKETKIKIEPDIIYKKQITEEDGEKIKKIDIYSLEPREDYNEEIEVVVTYTKDDKEVPLLFVLVPIKDQPNTYRIITINSKAKEQRLSKLMKSELLKKFLENKEFIAFLRGNKKTIETNQNYKQVLTLLSLKDGDVRSNNGSDQLNGLINKIKTIQSPYPVRTLQRQIDRAIGNAAENPNPKIRQNKPQK